MTTETTPADRLRSAAQRALESLDDLIAYTTDPGVEALGARYELARELSNTSPEAARRILGTTEQPDPVGLCGHCGVPRESHHHGYVSTADAIAAEPGTIEQADTVAAPAVDRATVLREAADRVDATDLPDDYVDMFDNGARWATTQFRRLAAEAQQPSPCGRPVAMGTPCSAGDHCCQGADEAQQPTPAPAEETKPCGNTLGVSGRTYRPCARPAGHPEVYCRDASGGDHFIAATPAPAEETK